MNQARSVAVRTILQTLHPEAMSEGTVETPDRVSKMWDELTAGYTMDPKTILSKTFDVDAGGDANANGIVLVKDIPFYSCCEHHMVPFFGTVSSAYMP